MQGASPPAARRPRPDQHHPADGRYQGSDGSDGSDSHPPSWGPSGPRNPRIYPLIPSQVPLRAIVFEMAPVTMRSMRSGSEIVLALRCRFVVKSL